MKLLAAITFSVAALTGQAAMAQSDWKPGSVVEFIVPAGPGGSLDMVARQIQKIAIEKKLVDSMIISNRPGGALAMALNDLDKHPGDANYLMTLTTSIINNNITGSLKDRPYTNYSPIAILFQEYVGLIVHKDSPYKTAQDLVNSMKADPAKLNVALATSLGNHIHVGAALPLQKAGVDVQKINFIPYKSSAESITNLLGKNVDVVAASTPNFLTALKNDQLRILVVGSPKRLPGELSGIPTWKESGVDVVTTSIQGILGPKDLKPAQISYWGKAFDEITSTDEWKKFVEMRGWAPDFVGPDQVKQTLAEETQRIQEILDTLGLSRNK
ncbi:Bug family tripartite tricarboxylate transporter substrate binding protein [Orrella marina]|uniref:Tripartite tricarboxylate transporter substrate binding protein n=1 Tax=Orrella marina TaxID=2163011 RepID=A0A2R4XGE5_9BURK|nr:tripartite tricarboxylate transporter substrate binding protein [Orrella marina]AWB32844.1 tripartite tricarboxylate transporter substrate binding protein [Orrella marina]